MVGEHSFGPSNSPQGGVGRFENRAVVESGNIYEVPCKFRDAVGVRLGTKATDGEYHPYGARSRS